MRRIRLTVAYDGAGYCGWQIQPNGVTVEETVMKAIENLTGERVRLIGASRTDSGVHALGNVAVFDTCSSVPSGCFADALNSRLPDDISVIKSEEVSPDFHPRKNVISKTYEYHIVNTPVRIPTRRFTSVFVSYGLDIGKMREAASFLVGTHDFSAFANIRSSSGSAVRRIISIDIAKRADEIIVRIEGESFLYNMVRIIVGTLLRVGRGYYGPERVKEILESKNRKEAGPTAPARGLILAEIKYAV